MRSFPPQIMPQPHSHGHIEFNWLTAGTMDYMFDGARCQSGRAGWWRSGPVFRTRRSGWATSATGASSISTCRMDAFLEMPQLGRLTETLMGGGVIQLNPDCIGARNARSLAPGLSQRQCASAPISCAPRSAPCSAAPPLPAGIRCCRPGSSAPARVPAPARRVRYVVRMVRHIVENITDPLSAEDIAKVVGLHPNYATNLFTKVMHISVQKFVTRMRLIRARSLLFDGSLSIANVAFQAGFVSQTQFYEHFRKAYGMTPSQMRKDTIEG